MSATLGKENIGVSMQNATSGCAVNVVSRALSATCPSFASGMFISVVATVTMYARTTFTNAASARDFSAISMCICVVSTDRTYVVSAVDRARSASGADLKKY